MEVYEPGINMVVSLPAPLTRCEPERPWFDAPPLTPQEEAAFEARKDRIIEFHSKVHILPPCGRQ